jgi:hypothetical protein
MVVTVLVQGQGYPGMRLITPGLIRPLHPQLRKMGIRLPFLVSESDFEDDHGNAEPLFMLIMTEELERILITLRS